MKILRISAVLALMVSTSQAALIIDTGITSLTSGDPLQLGRLSRNGIVADWSSSEPFPGVINPGTSYRYHIYTISNILYPFIQITFDDVSGGANTFASAYRGSYDPLNKMTNYLGDEGFSGNAFGTDPSVFQVIPGVGSDLVVLVNDASGTGDGVGQTYDILVEGFVDTQFNDVIPEPATVFLCGSGLGGGLLLALILRKRKSAAIRLVAMVCLCAIWMGTAHAQSISASARKQIQDILFRKARFTAAQNKMGSRLTFAAKAARNELAAASFSPAVAPVRTNAQGRVVVDIRGNVSASLLSEIQSVGGQVIQQAAGSNRIRASLPLGLLDTVAGHPDVSRIRLPARAHTNGSALKLLAEKRRSLSRNPLLERKLSFFIGAVTSQGYVSHVANSANAAGYSGAGVKIGVLSDSASPERVAALIASGDLPASTVVLPGQDGTDVTGFSDEGTAMMEIIHDLAPGAQLYFATAFESDVSFAANIIALQQAGCKVIVDDVGYSEEGVFQDGIIAQAVNQVVAAGTIYFSAAANSGNLTHGTSGTWEGDFVDGGAPDIEVGSVHNFGTLANPQPFNQLIAKSSADDYVLQWADPLGASSNDYDFFLLDSTGTTVKGFSVNIQDGTEDPLEEIYVPGISNDGDLLVVVLFSGSPRAMHIDTERGVLSIATDGATFGHSAGLNTVSMAASAWNSAHAGTKPFSGFANPTEIFSSDGPRKVFFNPDGTAITPGNFLFSANGGATLQKPDLTAADGVFAKTPGFLPFFGTSAAAPHAAAIAALVLQARPDYTPSQIKTAMTATALDSMVPGVDRDSGFGITMAVPAIHYALTH